MKEEEQDNFDVETYTQIVIYIILVLIYFIIETQKEDFETVFVKFIVFPFLPFLAVLIAESFSILFINARNKLRGLSINFSKKDILILVATVISFLIWVISAMQVMTDTSDIYLGVLVIFITAFLYFLHFFVGHKS